MPFLQNNAPVYKCRCALQNIDEIGFELDDTTQMLHFHQIVLNVSVLQKQLILTYYDNS